MSVHRAPSSPAPTAPPAGIRGQLAADLAAPARWPVLDGVRGLALVGVVVYHLLRFVIDTGDVRLSWPWWTFMGTARLGLDAFFVLSGILVVVSWRAVRRRASGTVDALRTFWRRRARRIFPAYWLSLLVFVPLLAPEFFQSLEGWGKMLLFVTVQQNVIDTLPDDVNTVYWTLTTEFHFYLLVPLVAWLSLRGRWRWAALAGTLALSYAWWDGLRGPLAPSFIFGRLDQFVVGALVGDVIVRAADRRGPGPSRLVAFLQRRETAWALGVALLAVGTWHGSRLWRAPLTWFDPLLHPVVGLLLAGLFLHLLAEEQPATRSVGRAVLTRPSMRFLGLISYSVYLWHYPLQEHGLAWLGAEPGTATPLLVVVAAGVVVLGLCLVVGVASYLAAERPFLRRKEPHRPDERAGPAPGSGGREPLVPSGGAQRGGIA